MSFCIYSTRNVDIIFNKYVAIRRMGKKKEIRYEVMKPITKVNSKKDMELQELEVESTGAGVGAGGN